MTIKVENPRTKKVLQLLSVLATPLPPFMQSWEEKAWFKNQVDAFWTLYKQHQDNPRVNNFMVDLDGGSRTDSSVEDAVWRARKTAPLYLRQVLQDVEEDNTCPTAPKTGDPVYDQWSDGRQVVTADGFGSEWKRQAVREANKGIEYEVGFTGYVQEKNK